MKQNELYLLPITTLGGAKMVKRDMWYEIHSRFKRNESKKSIARTLDLDVRTVRKILSQSEPKRYQRQTSGDTLLTGYQDYIKKRLEAVGYCAQSIYEELKERGYSGGYDTVRRFMHIPVNPATDSGVIRSLVSAKRRCGFIISPCGRNESMEIYVFS